MRKKTIINSFFQLFTYIFCVVWRKIIVERRQTMKDGVILGMLIGAVAGAIVVQTCKPVQDIIEKGKQKFKEKVAKM